MRRKVSGMQMVGAEKGGKWSLRSMMHIVNWMCGALLSCSRRAFFLKELIDHADQHIKRGARPRIVRQAGLDQGLSREQGMRTGVWRGHTCTGQVAGGCSAAAARPLPPTLQSYSPPRLRVRPLAAPAPAAAPPCYGRSGWGAGRTRRAHWKPSVERGAAEEGEGYRWCSSSTQPTNAEHLNLACGRR